MTERDLLHRLVDDLPEVDAALVASLAGLEGERSAAVRAALAEARLGASLLEMV